MDKPPKQLAALTKDERNESPPGSDGGSRPTARTTGAESGTGPLSSKPLICDECGSAMGYVSVEEYRELQAEIERLTRELHYTTQAGVIECAVRNPAVAEYMRHWESRTEKAEAEYERLRASATNVESLQCEIERLRALQAAHEQVNLPAFAELMTELEDARREAARAKLHLDNEYYRSWKMRAALEAIADHAYCATSKEVAREALRGANEPKTGMPPETCEFSDSGTHECKHCDALFGPAVNPKASFCSSDGRGDQPAIIRVNS